MIVALAGRRIDAPDAKEPRFPLASVQTVRDRVKAALAGGTASAVVSAAACGADLIALDVAGELGLRRHIVLPYDAAMFRERSVVDRPGPWGDLFDRIIAQAKAGGWLHVMDFDPQSERVYERTNEAILDDAAALAANATEVVCAFVVWDGAIGGRVDYTAAFADEARRRDIAVESVPIVARAAASGSPAPAVDDVVDAHDDVVPGEPLYPALEACRTAIVPAYLEADQLALVLQRRHRMVVKWSATLGTSAIIVGLLQLLPGVSAVGKLAVIVDAVFTLLAAAAVLLGVVASLQQRWYLQRHRAELLRLLKYRKLLEYAATPLDPAAFDRWKSALADKVNSIRTCDREQMNEWSEFKGAPDAFSVPHADAAAANTLAAFRDYYVRKRLEFQKRYFHRKADEYEASDQRLRAVPPILFLLSVAFACTHFFIAYLESAYGSESWLSPLGPIAIVASAICVVAAGMFRILRSSNEYARNTMRFRAKDLTLASIASRLNDASAPPDVAALVFETEQVLEEEHREWLRLMREAEWFG